MPLDIERRITDKELAKLSMTDWYLHHLYDFLPDAGVTVLYSNYSRNVIDMNRAGDSSSLYPGRFETKLVPDKTFQGDEIFSEYPTDLQIHHHTINAHQPYHLALNTLLNDCKKRHGKAYLLDLHSIAPHKTLIHDELEHDIYLGNRDGKSCSQDWMERIAFLYKMHSFDVQKNEPYKGGFITDHYGQDDDIHALQIEMNQTVYLTDFSDQAVRPKNHDDLQDILNSEKFVEAKQRISLLFNDILGSILQ